jgi:hypothetical protein
LQNHIELDRKVSSTPTSYSANGSTVFYSATIKKDSIYNNVSFPQRKGSLELWVNGSFSDSTYIGNIFDQFENNRDHIVIRSYGQYGKALQIHFYDKSVQTYTFSYNLSLDANFWNFLVLTWDVDQKKVEIFVNGRWIHTGTIKNSNWLPANQNVLFGRGFNGGIEQVRILSNPLTLSEVRNDWGLNYCASGIIRSIAIEPFKLTGWDSLRWWFTKPVNTDITVSIEDSSSEGWRKISDVQTSPISISFIQSSSVKKLRLRADLQTADSQVTPLFKGWSISWKTNLAHPRLYITDSTITSLRGSIASDKEPYTKYFNDIRQRAIALANKTPPDGNSGTILDDAQSRAVAWDLTTLLTAAVITDSLPFKTATRKYVDSILAYPRWGGNRDLGAGHILFALSLAYDWMYNAWSDSLKNCMEKKIAVYGDTLRRFASGSTSYLHNHNHVNVSGVMAAAVATYDVNPLANEWIRHCKDNFTKTLELASPDGVSVEDLAYYTYGLEAQLRYFDLEESFLSEQRINANKWFENTWSYRLYGSQPKIWETALFGDGPNSDYYGPGYMLFRLASRFRNPAAQWLALDITNHQIARNNVGGRIDFRNLIWYDSSLTPSNHYSLPTYKLFPNMSFFSSRSAWNDTDAVFFATEAAPPMGTEFYTKALYDMGSSHQHPDKGHFIFKAFNTDLAIDDGYSYLKKSAAHNIITFDSGKGQLGEGYTWYQGQAFIPYNNPVGFIHTEFTDKYEYLIANLTHAYPSTLKIKNYNRHFLFIKKNALLIVDEVELDTVRTVEWRLHSDTNAAFTITERSLSMKNSISNAGYLLEDLSAMASDTSILGYYERFDTVYLETRFVVNGCKNRQFMLKKKAQNARFDLLLRPFKTDKPEKISYSWTLNDTLKLSSNNYTAIVHTASKFIRIDSLSVGTEKKNTYKKTLTAEPNPFNPSTKIIFQLPHDGKVLLTIFDCAGKKVSTLINDVLKSGYHEISWIGIGSGLYFAAFENEGTVMIKKIVLTK